MVVRMVDGEAAAAAAAGGALEGDLAEMVKTEEREEEEEGEEDAGLWMGARSPGRPVAGRHCVADVRRGSFVESSSLRVPEQTSRRRAYSAQESRARHPSSGGRQRPPTATAAGSGLDQGTSDGTGPETVRHRHRSDIGALRGDGLLAVPLPPEVAAADKARRPEVSTHLALPSGGPTFSAGTSPYPNSGTATRLSPVDSSPSAAASSSPSAAGAAAALSAADVAGRSGSGCRASTTAEGLTSSSGHHVSKIGGTLRQSSMVQRLRRLSGRSSRGTDAESAICDRPVEAEFSGGSDAAEGSGSGGIRSGGMNGQAMPTEDCPGGVERNGSPPPILNGNCGGTGSPQASKSKSRFPLTWRRCLPARLRYRWQHRRRVRRPPPPAFWQGFKEYGVGTLPRLAAACRQKSPSARRRVAAARRWLLRMRRTEPEGKPASHQSPRSEEKPTAASVSTMSADSSSSTWSGSAESIPADSAPSPLCALPVDWWRHLYRLWCPSSAAAPAPGETSPRRVHRLSGPCDCEHCRPPPPADTSASGGRLVKLSGWWEAAAELVARLGASEKKTAVAMVTPFGTSHEEALLSRYYDSHYGGVPLTESVI